MRYQDPPGSQDPARDPSPRLPGGPAPAGYRAHQRQPDHQHLRQGWPEDRGGHDGSAGALWNAWEASQERDWGGDRDVAMDPAAPPGAPDRPPGEHRRKPAGAGRGGLVAGAVTGLLAAGIALGVAMLVAAFVRPQASPVIAVGEEVINLTPTALKEFAIQRFGQNDKTALLSGVYVVIGLLAMLIGWLGRRSLSAGAIGIGLFGAFGAYVALAQAGSRSTDVIPSLAGGVAGAVAIIALVRSSRPAVRPAAVGNAGLARNHLARARSGATGRIDRRRFLLAGTAIAAVAAGSAVGGQILANRRFNANASRAAVKLTPVRKAPPLPRQAELNIPGLTSFYTPNSSFYRVDTALVVPQVTTQQWSLRVHGLVDRELNISFHDLIRMPMVERDITIMCVSDQVGGNYIGNARWQGVLLSDVLRQARVRSGVSELATQDVNGMTIGVPTDIALDGRDTMLAVGMNGVPLPQEHGFPVRLVVPGLYGYCSATKWITDIELTTLGAFTPYWVHRGWAKVAPIKTESRIDTPKAGGSLKAGRVMVAGVAWAQHKGIEQVEVRVDGGQWFKATLAAQDQVDTWRQWYLPWAATTGQHTLTVRATDKTGYTQTPVVRPVSPNGASGYHTVRVAVA